MKFNLGEPVYRIGDEIKGEIIECKGFQPLFGFIYSVKFSNGKIMDFSEDFLESRIKKVGSAEKETKEIRINDQLSKLQQLIKELN